MFIETMRRTGMILLLLAVLIAGYGADATDNAQDAPGGGSRPKGRSPIELHLKLKPSPRIVQEILLPDVTSFVASQKADVPKWTIHLPDNTPIDTAIVLFKQFQNAGCSNLAVYAEDARGDWPKRDIGVEVGPNDPVRIVTEFAQAYSERLNAFRDRDFPPPQSLFVATSELSELGDVLPLLLAVSKRKHVRLQETGGTDGMAAQRYVDVLEHLKKMGVTSVSFYGVYLE
jgi:hypothetical protein